MSPTSDLPKNPSDKDNILKEISSYAKIAHFSIVIPLNQEEVAKMAYALAKHMDSNEVDISEKAAKALKHLLRRCKKCLSSTASDNLKNSLKTCLLAKLSNSACQARKDFLADIIGILIELMYIVKDLAIDIASSTDDFNTLVHLTSRDEGKISEKAIFAISSIMNTNGGSDEVNKQFKDRKIREKLTKSLLTHLSANPLNTAEKSLNILKALSEFSEDYMNYLRADEKLKIIPAIINHLQVILNQFKAKLLPEKPFKAFKNTVIPWVLSLTDDNANLQQSFFDNFSVTIQAAILEFQLDIIEHLVSDDVVQKAKHENNRKLIGQKGGIKCLVAVVKHKKGIIFHNRAEKLLYLLLNNNPENCSIFLEEKVTEHSFTKAPGLISLTAHDIFKKIDAYKIHKEYDADHMYKRGEASDHLDIGNIKEPSNRSNLALAQSVIQQNESQNTSKRFAQIAIAFSFLQFFLKELVNLFPELLMPKSTKKRLLSTLEVENNPFPLINNTALPKATEGSFSHISYELVTKKVAKNDDHSKAHLENEINIFKKMFISSPAAAHENCIVRFLYSSPKHYEYIPWITLEYADTNLRELIRPESIDFVGEFIGMRVTFMLNIVKALTFIHKQNIIHCDIKPENILVKYNGSEYRALLSDFGSAIAKNDRAGMRGTETYNAPEVLKLQPRHEIAYTEAIDVFSLSIVLWETFYMQDANQAYRESAEGAGYLLVDEYVKNKNRLPTEQCPNEYREKHSQFCDLLTEAWSDDPAKRKLSSIGQFFNSFVKDHDIERPSTVICSR